VLTVAVTLGIFMIGMLSDWLFGRPAKALAEIVQRDGSGALSASEHVWLFASKALHTVVPNFQMFWLSDALTQKSHIPASYMLTLVIYGLLLIVATLAIAVALFQRREVG
jgi:hypothetical protein